MGEPLDIGLFVRASLDLYKECIAKASLAFVRGWPFIIGSIVLYLIFLVSSTLFGGLGLAGGFIVGFIQIGLITVYYEWLSELFQGNRLSFQDLISFNSGLFMNIIGAAFILWIAMMALELLLQGIAEEFILLVRFVVVVVFNSLPEVIYIDREDGAQALVASANFTRDNWIEWFLPFLAILSPLLFISPVILLTILPNSEILLPVLTITLGWEIIAQISGLANMMVIPVANLITINLGTIFCLIPASWLMLFRAQLYYELSRGTRRSRIYRMKQR